MAGSCLLVVAAVAAVARLYPVDDTDRDPAFQSYVRKLRSTVEKRNPAALRKLVAHDVFIGPADSDKGWPSFSTRWHLDRGQNSNVWTVLSRLLSLGFVQEHPRLFLSPYLVWRFPRELNPAAHLVVMRDNAILREAPSPRAPAAAVLSFDIVRPLGEAQETGELLRWIQVRTSDGKTGFLEIRDVMSPLIPRAQFGMREGRWLLVALEGSED